ncbi:hypothetical protein CEXT_311131 [Caerostris extrusa]|uniref:Uncharacterized protein n=1 Tax=Caerostris extrusa TaxID=172846 RepID=A0AAV4PR46_CAEEX|nr:hypothetical protein CEXT_311131 [Caerostris extrusa]
MNFRQLPNHEALRLLFTSPRLRKLGLPCFLVPSCMAYDANDPYDTFHLKTEIFIQEELRECMRNTTFIVIGNISIYNREHTKKKHGRRMQFFAAQAFESIRISNLLS